MMSRFYRIVNTADTAGFLIESRRNRVLDAGLDVFHHRSLLDFTEASAIDTSNVSTSPSVF
jgi:hypothetical protein